MSDTPLKQVDIFTDGACSGNPGRGGFGAILRYNGHVKEISGGAMETTNNRMELMAVIAGLEALKIQGSRVVVYTDSKYVSDAVEKGWLFQWESKAFKKKKNPDLWLRFLNIYRQHKVKFVWIKGHSSIPENEKCDKMAVDASKKPVLLEDTGYLTENGNETLFID